MLASSFVFLIKNYSLYMHGHLSVDMSVLIDGTSHIKIPSFLPYLLTCLPITFGIILTDTTQSVLYQFFYPSL